MKTKLLLPALILLLMLAAPAAKHEAGCGATYCVSIHESVSVGSASLTLNPEVAVVAAAQVIATIVVVSQLMLVLQRLGHVIPVSLLRELEHVSCLESSAVFNQAKAKPFFWLPIESISSGRITSKMLRTEAFFGPGWR